jgi:hypothetical protein
MLQVKSALAGYEQVWSQRRRDSSGGSSTQQFAPRVTPSLTTLFTNFDCYMVSCFAAARPNRRHMQLQYCCSSCKQLIAYIRYRSSSMLCSLLECHELAIFFCTDCNILCLEIHQQLQYCTCGTALMLITNDRCTTVDITVEITVVQDMGRPPETTTLTLLNISIENLPVDDTPCIDVWDSDRLVYSSKDPSDDEVLWNPSDGFFFHKVSTFQQLLVLPQLNSASSVVTAIADTNAAN